MRTDYFDILTFDISIAILCLYIDVMIYDIIHYACDLQTVRLYLRLHITLPI